MSIRQNQVAYHRHADVCRACKESTEACDRCSLGTRLWDRVTHGAKEDLYFILNKERSAITLAVAVWWLPDSHGYTWLLAGAGRYTEGELAALNLDPREDTAIECGEAERLPVTVMWDEPLLKVRSERVRELLAERDDA
jgi:hypothetical protein